MNKMTGNYMLTYQYCHDFRFFARIGIVSFLFFFSYCTCRSQFLKRPFLYAPTTRKIVGVNFNLIKCSDEKSIVDPINNDSFTYHNPLL